MSFLDEFKTMVKLRTLYVTLPFDYEIIMRQMAAANTIAQINQGFVELVWNVSEAAKLVPRHLAHTQTWTLAPYTVTFMIQNLEDYDPTNYAKLRLCYDCTEDD